MKRQLITALFCFVIGFFVTANAVAENQKYKLTITGASPGGLWSLLGAGIDSAVRAGYPGSFVTYQTSGGGLANVGIVSKGGAELGIVHNVELKAAVQGSAPFKSPVTNLRAIAYLYNWAPMQLIMNKKFANKYGINNVADLVREKPPVRFAVNTRGNMVQEVNKEILSAYGVSYDDVKSWGGQILYAASKEQGDFLGDGRIDMFGNGVFAPHKSIIKASRVVDVIMLELSVEASQKVANKTGADPYIVKQESYAWLNKDIRTVALGAELVVNDSMSEQIAYDITKTLVENIDKMRGVHKSMKSLTPEMMASQNVIQYHPGAIRYYKEVGLIK